MRCLYLTPLKPPDHPTPSGDRLIARLFIALLERLGYDVTLASRLRTRCSTPEALPALVEKAEQETARILAAEAGQETPALVFTYHNYYKAPDLVGPRLAAALKVPHVIAEASRAPRRAEGPFAAGHLLAEAASDGARLILSPTRHDMLALAAAQPEGQHLVHLPPFLDLAGWPQALLPPPSQDEPSQKGLTVRLLTVAMMRAGYKLASYQALATALAPLGHLAPLEDLDWTLDIVGDGEMRPAVEAAFQPLGSRVRWHGALQDVAALGALYRSADLFVWPAIDEPFGMVFLEAQAHGLPCLAHGYRGVPDVVADGVSGIIVAPGDAAAFATQLARLLGDADMRGQLSAGALAHVRDRHTMASAQAAVAAAFREAGIRLP